MSLNCLKQLDAVAATSNIASLFSNFKNNKYSREVSVCVCDITALNKDKEEENKARAPK